MHFRNSIYTLLACCSIVLFWQCKTSQKAFLQPATDSNSLLWQISGKGISQPSFLYGTIHLIDEKDYFLYPPTQKAFDACKQIAFEIDMNEMSDMSMLTGMMTGMMMNGDTTLKDLLTTDEYMQVDSFFNTMGVPLMFLQRMKPMLLSMMTDIDPSMMMGGETGGTKSYELELMEKAKSKKMKTYGLETAAFQLRLFDSIPYKAQAQMLMKSIRGENKESDLEYVVKLYKTQNIEAMVSVMQNESDIAEYEHLLLTNRNRNWIPKIEQLISEQATFIAVGAGHLGGADGVISLLRKQGYVVTPIKNK